MTIIERMEAYLLNYVTFEDSRVALVLALWSAASHIFETFDAFPYVVITSMTKRSGKTRTSELIGMLSCNSQNFAAMTASTLFRVINQNTGNMFCPEESRKTPTIIFDEAEMLSSESASTMRAVLNVGYRKGQTIPRTVGNEVVFYNTYCPKVFVLIGDVYDTLRDRSVVISLVRAEPKKRFRFEEAKADADALKVDILAELKKPHIVEGIAETYKNVEAKYLSDRDEEIWSALLAIGAVLLPTDRFEGLQRTAVDLCASKTAEKRRYTTLDMFDTEAENDEYAVKLLKDVWVAFQDRICVDGKTIAVSPLDQLESSEILKRLYALPLAPWRKFRGDGLTVNTLADLLSRFAVIPANLRIRGKANTVRRGYKRRDVENAIAKI